MSGTDLAYIGDVVYELYIRTRTVWPLKRTTDLQQKVVALVRGMNDVWYILFFIFARFLTSSLFVIAEHQSKLLQQLRQDTSSFPLTIKEEQVMNRGRNAAAARSNNNHRHHPIIYQDSTAFEALVGYLYISDTERCTKLFQWIESNVDTV
jgi:ribonuclease III family protein